MKPNRLRDQATPNVEGAGKDPTEAAAYLDRAMAALEQGEFDFAIADSTRAVELDPTLALAFITSVPIVASFSICTARNTGSNPIATPHAARELPGRPGTD